MNNDEQPREEQRIDGIRPLRHLAAQNAAYIWRLVDQSNHWSTGQGGRECVTEFLCYISSRVTFLVLHVGDHVWST